MSLLGKIQAAVGRVQENQDLNELRFRHTATWSDGVTCRFSVQDVNKVDTPATRSLRNRPDAPDLRLLKVHPDDPCPAVASKLPWENGWLFVEHYAQTSDITTLAPGVCVHVVPERIASYPLAFPTAGPLVKQPGTGNMLPSPGPPIEVLARLESVTDPKLLSQIGADTLDLPLFGRWGAPGFPSARPPGVEYGSQSPLVLQGVAGTLTVRMGFPDADPITAAIHGEAFLAVWRNT